MSYCDRMLVVPARQLARSLVQWERRGVETHRELESEPALGQRTVGSDTSGRQHVIGAVWLERTKTQDVCNTDQLQPDPIKKHAGTLCKAARASNEPVARCEAKKPEASQDVQLPAEAEHGHPRHLRQDRGGRGEGEVHRRGAPRAGEEGEEVERRHHCAGVDAAGLGPEWKPRGRR